MPAEIETCLFLSFDQQCSLTIVLFNNYHQALEYFGLDSPLKTEDIAGKYN
ncbi:hypothetical protein DPMN_039212 [Dreissena polymorpha]|uniref:Uncharacterized protein n=1 Tax=Dreissena polymorpha TaxID=45954 RepID=A0A9D4MG52_DREPO|nr:hypothetical protein DPMN_039212 [Dreissena polymorpha]